MRPTRGVCAAALTALLVIAAAGCGREQPPTLTKPVGPRHPSGPRVPPLPRSFFGMNAQLLEPLAASGQLSLVDQSLGEIERLGIGFVRSSFDWRAVEPSAPVGTSHRYDFDSLDVWVSLLATHHLRWLVTVKGNPTPTWALSRSASAACGSRAPPEGEASYAALTGALARRYGARGSFWQSHPGLPQEPITDYEVWNEPNSAVLWCPSPSPDAYARLYLAAHAAIHAVDPHARVLIGGLATYVESHPPDALSVADFLGPALDSDPALRGAIDAVAVHPYGQSPAEVLGKLRDLRSTLDSLGLRGVPMSADELGWYTHGIGGAPPTSEARRADDFSVLTPAIAASGCDVIGLAAHTWITPEQNSADREDWYGLASPQTGEPYPSAIAYGDQVRALEQGMGRRGEPPACGGSGNGGPGSSKRGGGR